MRYNPPTSWPTPPPGWSPPEGWNPEPGWPPAPPAWPFWLADDGTPLPVAFGSPVPPWDPRAVTAAGVGSVWPVAPADDETAIRDARRAALRLFGIGVLVFVAFAVSLILAGRSLGGGVVWIGGLVVGAGLLVRALTAYRATRSAAVPAKPASVVAVVAGLVVCLGTGIGAIVSYATPIDPKVEAGTCWKDGDTAEEVLQVACSDDHDYRVDREVADPATCPEYYVEFDGKFGCLVDD